MSGTTYGGAITPLMEYEGASRARQVIAKKLSRTYIGSKAD